MSRAHGRRASALLVVVAVLLGACSEGDIVRVVLPAARCERPADPAWSVVRPLCGVQPQQDAVWVREDLAVIVGGAGLAMAWDGATWSREESGTERELLSAAAAPGGTVCAVGTAGTVALRTAAGWSAQQVAGLGDLERVNAAGEEFWAVGRDGALVRIAGGRAARVTPPPSGDLLDVLAVGDSLWTAGGAAGLHVRAEGAWAAVTPPLLAGQEVRSVTVLDDGRLVVLADALYVREVDRWVSPVLLDDTGLDLAANDRLRVRDGALWLDGSANDNGRLELGPDGWRVTRWWFGRALAPLDRGRVLVVSSGGIVWLLDGEVVIDPAGDYSSRSVVRFQDGTCAFASRIWGLETMVDGELVPLDEPAAADRQYLGAEIGGRSTADFYSLPADELWHFVDGSARKVADIPRDYWIDGLVPLPTGGVLLFLGGGGVWRWNGTELVDLSLRDEERVLTLRPLAAGADGPVLASAYGQVYRLEGETWVATPLEDGCRVGGVLPDGRVVMVSEDPLVAGVRLRPGRYLHFWDPTGGDLTTTRTEFLEICDDLEIDGAATGPTGFHVWTRSAPLVFRLRTDGLDPAWELVAGPLDHELYRLAVQPDGSLLADDRHRIFWHPGRRD